MGITSFGGGDRRSPLWATGPLEVRRAGSTLVRLDRPPSRPAGPAAAPRSPSYARCCREWRERPRGRGAGVGGRASTPPSTPSRASYADIAAVTASVDGSLTPGAPVHVFVNPDVYDGLDAVGGQVVMSHEATHVATDAPLTTGVPLWLLEGFADYVALHDVDLPLSTTAGQIIAAGAPRRRAGGAARAGRVRRDRHPPRGGLRERVAGLPWCSPTRRARRRWCGSTSGLARRRPDERLEASFGLTEAELTARWRQRLDTWPRGRRTAPDGPGYATAVAA